MKNSFYYFPIILIVLLFSCSDGEETTPTTPESNAPTIPGESADWLIPENQIFDGGPGKDGIPSVDSPQFSKVSEVDVSIFDFQYLNGDPLVVAVNYGNEPRAYPHTILDWHEIVNDKIGEVILALTYCPLTGTGIGWDRIVDGEETTFGVSGLLYNTNLLPYDRATDSNWSQMRHQCVNGERQGTIINTHHVVEMPFSTYQKMYPEGQVMDIRTGFRRNYGAYPYGGYRTNEQIIFPITNEDERFHPKERVLGVIKGEISKAYTFATFPGNEITVVTDQVAGEDIVIIGSQGQNFMTAYNRKQADGTLLSFEAVSDQLPIALVDNEGNEWDIFGNAITGPREGARLDAPLNYIGYWFAWATFNPEIEVF